MELREQDHKDSRQFEHKERDFSYKEYKGKRKDEDAFPDDREISRNSPHFSFENNKMKKLNDKLNKNMEKHQERTRNDNPD